MRFGSQQLTECQKEWPMGRALKYGHGWLTSVGRGWTKRRDILHQRFPTMGGMTRWGSWGVRLDGNSYPRTRSPFPRAVGSSDSMFLALTWSSPASAQAVAPLKPSFWTHSLQICWNESAGPRSRPPLGPVRKPWPYIYIYIYIYFINNFSIQNQSEVWVREK